MTNRWFEFAGTAGAVAAALNGEDSEHLEDNDGQEHCRKRKADEKDTETESDDDDEFNDGQKRPAKKPASGDKAPRGIKVSGLPSLTSAWDIQSYGSASTNYLCTLSSY
jgi:hypothetical protein